MKLNPFDEVELIYPRCWLNSHKCRGDINNIHITWDQFFFSSFKAGHLKRETFWENPLRLKNFFAYWEMWRKFDVFRQCNAIVIVIAVCAILLEMSLFIMIDWSFLWWYQQSTSKSKKSDIKFIINKTISLFSNNWTNTTQSLFLFQFPLLQCKINQQFKFNLTIHSFISKLNL